jgi:hypothetical protein
MPYECFADEIAIDFPSVGSVVERMRDRFLGERASVDDEILAAEVSVTRSEASKGLVVPLDIPVRTTCAHCGGRGETWTEPCLNCCGTGESLSHHSVRVSVPAGVADGARFRFRLTPHDASTVRVEVRVAIRPAAF